MSEFRRSRIALIRGQSSGDCFCCPVCFCNEVAQCLRGISKQTVADGPLAIDEPSNGSFIYPEPPRKCSGSTKQLDAVSEVILSILHIRII